MASRPYEVALSFAGEDRTYVEMVADQLRGRSVSVFYDRYQEADLWGKDLYAHLVDLYMKQARYTLMFISVHYRNKVWTNHERRAAQARAMEEAGEYMLPARFDDTEILGVLPTTGFIDLRYRSPVDVAVLVCEKLGRNIFAQKAHAIASPRTPALSGVATFDYSSHDGRFRIGDGRLEFETKWSGASSRSIHCYSDCPSIRGVALAQNATRISEIKDATALDFTSRARSPDIGQLVVLQNINGFYAAVQIVGIVCASPPTIADELKFRYWILADGTADFSHITEP
jgi:hypothetical protein